MPSCVGSSPPRHQCAVCTTHRWKRSRPRTAGAPLSFGALAADAVEADLAAVARLAARPAVAGIGRERHALAAAIRQPGGARGAAAEAGVAEGEVLGDDERHEVAAERLRDAGEGAAAQ